MGTVIKILCATHLTIVLTVVMAWAASESVENERTPCAFVSGAFAMATIAGWIWAIVLWRMNVS